MLKTLVAATLYTALTLAAIPAQARDLSAAADAREGAMRKLIVHDAPKPLDNIRFQTADGVEETLDTYAGRWVVLNLWATWCAPCRKEMPALDALSEAYNDRGISVVPVATGRNSLPAIKGFYDKAEIGTLPVRLDPTGELARGLGVMGLPATLIISPEGLEVARMVGDADWFSPSALAVMDALLETVAD